MKWIHQLFTAGYAIVALLFVIAAILLTVFAGYELSDAILRAEVDTQHVRFNSILEGIGLLTIAVAALELGQTILEEEVQRSTQLSTPTRVRRFLSRFMIVIVISLSIEFLVATFQYIHDSPSDLIYAASIGIATAGLIAAWGLFVHLNRSAEELEPSAIDKVQAEDEELE
jgi:hypothetical protein